MNSVDATCAVCGKPIRWISGTSRVCPSCRPHGTGADRSVDAPYQFGRPQDTLEPFEISRLRRRFENLLNNSVPIHPADQPGEWELT